MLQSTWGCMYLFKWVFFLFSLGGGKNPEVELLDHMVALFPNFFWGTSVLFSTVAASIRILINNIRGFPFLYILANTCYLLSFWWQPFWQVWGYKLLLYHFPNVTTQPLKQVAVWSYTSEYIMIVESSPHCAT